jgi:hypothetical protein
MDHDSRNWVLFVNFRADLKVLLRRIGETEKFVGDALAELYVCFGYLVSGWMTLLQC